MAEKKEKAKKSKNTAKKKFFFDFKSEFKKIIWPKIGATFKNMGVVLSTIVLTSVFVGLLDFGCTSLLKLIMNTAV